MKIINFFIFFIFTMSVEGRELCTVNQSMTFRSTLDTYTQEEYYIRILKETLDSPPLVLFQNQDGRINEKSTQAKFRKLLSEAFLDDKPKLLLSKVTGIEGKFLFQTDAVNTTEHAFFVKVRGSEIDIYQYHPIEGTTESLSIMEKAITQCGF